VSLKIERNIAMKKHIDIIEVGPRDGFQNIKEYIPLKTKQRIIDGLISAGLRKIQITSFVNPEAIPQMRDAEELTDYCLGAYSELDLFALIPNLRGAKTAWEHGMKKVACVVSLSESHNMANIRSARKESLEGFERIRDTYPELELCVDIATAFGCPFEGKPSLDQLISFVGMIRERGITTIALCDTIGVANPAQIRLTVNKVREIYPSIQFQIHIHDTRGMGLVNTLTAIDCGIRTVQTTLGGLGGCPFAPGASGNTATEDLAYMLSEIGYDTGIDFNKLLQLAKEQHQMIHGNYSGHHLHIETPCEN